MRRVRRQTPEPLGQIPPVTVVRDRSVHSGFRYRSCTPAGWLRPSVTTYPPTGNAKNTGTGQRRQRDEHVFVGFFDHSEKEKRSELAGGLDTRKRLSGDRLFIPICVGADGFWAYQGRIAQLWEQERQLPCTTKGLIEQPGIRHLRSVGGDRMRRQVKQRHLTRSMPDFELAQNQNGRLLFHDPTTRWAGREEMAKLGIPRQEPARPSLRRGKRWGAVDRQ
jgi:hypothetical protein